MFFFLFIMQMKKRVNNEKLQKGKRSTKLKNNMHKNRTKPKK